MKDLRTYVINLGENAKVEGLKKCQIFSDLSDGEMRKLASRVTAVVFRKGTFIFKEGDPPDFFYVIYEGLVQLFKTSGSGKNVTFTIATQGRDPHRFALFLDTYFVSTRAMNDVTLLRIGRKDWLTFVGPFRRSPWGSSRSWRSGSTANMKGSWILWGKR